MKSAVVFGVLDIGTSKTVALVVEAVPGWSFKVLGYGQGPTQGMEQGQVVDMARLTHTVARAMQQALRRAGLREPDFPVWANVSARPVHAFNHRGAVGLPQGMVTEYDVHRAEEAAQAVPVEHNQMVLHVIRRGYRLDEKPVQWPVGMYGYRLEAEVHIITAPRADVFNLKQALEGAGLTVRGFILSALAAGEAVLTDGEREMGVVVCDIGAGTTDVAVYADREVAYAGVLPLAGNHLTQDLVRILSVPWNEAERLKLEYGYATPAAVPQGEHWLTIRPFGEGEEARIRQQDVAAILEARLRQILDRVREVIDASGRADALPAGVVLTGGTARIPGLRELVMRYLKMPVRIARLQPPPTWPPSLRGPEFATTLGLVHFAQAYLAQETGPVSAAPSRNWWSRFRAFLRGLLP